MLIIIAEVLDCLQPLQDCHSIDSLVGLCVVASLVLPLPVYGCVSGWVADSSGSGLCMRTGDCQSLFSNNIGS